MLRAIRRACGGTPKRQRAIPEGLIAADIQPGRPAGQIRRLIVADRITESINVPVARMDGGSSATLLPDYHMIVNVERRHSS